ncbi:hypothetical protein A9Q76_07415 [Arcobacter sp. 31_11_sub10_T18]|nr:hypothetical protein A9Q76_07415 [Arcobacter sp. 31_11_sub10_T18]
MKTQIVEIIRDTLSSLDKKDIQATPKNYSKEFYTQALEKDANIADLELLQNTIKSLDYNEQKLVVENNYNTYSELSQILLNRISLDELREFVFVIEELLQPSINYEIEEKIEYLTQKLIDDPKLILSKDTARNLRTISHERIDLDRLVVREKASDIVKLTTLMGKYFEKSIIQSGDSMTEVIGIKNEIEDLSLSKHTNREIGLLQTKLIDTVYNLENTIEKNHVELKQRQDDFNNLHETIQQLQKDLEKEKEQKHIDYLTGLLNRRAYEIEIKKFEKKYKVFDSSFAIIFLDIDHFKKINDNYGHDCGDFVLKTFGQILKMLTRDEDKVVRYGGEEFVTLIRYDEEKDVIKYLKRIKNLIGKNNFVYNNIKIKIKFCAGVALRTNYESYADTINYADKLLYKAKHTGRDKIILDDNTII